VTYYIEHDFPIEQLNPLARREANAKRAIAMLHKWWARRVGCVFRTMILASLIPEEEWRRLDEEMQRAGIDAWTALYYREHPKANPLIEKYLKDKVVLDPFMGGGTTIVEALRLGCKVIGVDVNPVAWFIVKKSIEPVDLDALDAAFERLKDEVAPDILKYYRTLCPSPLSSPSSLGRGEGGQGGEERAHLADVMYAFWVKKVQCTNCGRNTRLFNSFRLATKTITLPNGSRQERDFVVCPYCYWVGDVKAGMRSVVCPDCGQEFHPRKGWASGGKFTCEHCGHVDQTVEWVRRTGRAPEYEMFALEYWCSRHGRGYKGAEDFDKELYRKACQEFEKERTSLPLPEGDIPAEGRSDPRPISYGMTRWTDLFNSRQLLCLGRLMRAIKQIEDQAVQELMAVTLSDCARANNMLCTYEYSYQKLAPLFVFHAYRIPDPAVENNIWGTEYGRGTFSACFDKTRRAVEWAQSPREISIDGWMPMEDGTVTSPARHTSDVVDGISHAWLTARTSEDLSFLPAGSVDAVITDPPYYGNDQYGELSDFFYVWLRLGLKDDYPEFIPLVVPKEAEVLVNEKASKTDEYFRQGLFRCFQECQRVLKDDGVMAFTFHHEKAIAWGAVLEAVLEAQFDVKAVWTVHSEVRQGAHGGGIRFDTIVVCRKRLEEPAPAAWGALQDRIVVAVKNELRRLLDNGAALSSEDVFVITMGKALSVYSSHYPNVLHDGEQVKLTKAIEDIEALVDEQIDAYYGMVVPAWLDALSRIYLQHLARRAAVTRDSLVKVCRTRGLDFGELEEMRYVERGKRSGEYQVLLPQKRMDWLEKRLEKGYDLSPLDRAHYLYGLHKANRSLRPEIPRLYTRGLEEVTNALYRITRDRGYELITADIERLKEQGVLEF
jgi:adenine-specific DNA methylase